MKKSYFLIVVIILITTMIYGQDERVRMTSSFSRAKKSVAVACLDNKTLTKRDFPPGETIFVKNIPLAEGIAYTLRLIDDPMYFGLKKDRTNLIFTNDGVILICFIKQRHVWIIDYFKGTKLVLNKRIMIRTFSLI